MSQLISAQVSGTVYLDTNFNGVQEASETTGFAGVTVTAFDATNAQVGSTTTNASGGYSFTGLTVPIRVEFSTLPASRFPSIQGASSNTTVQFYSAASTTANLGLIHPPDFYEPNPQIVTPCYVESFEPVHDVMVKFSYLNTGTAAGDKTVISNNGQVGGLWGVAYSKKRRTLYASAVLKTHIPLGPGGLDAIYAIDPFTGAANATPWLELTDDLGIAVSPITAPPQYLTNAARGVDIAPQNDAQAFVDAGKMGIGDIDLSEDESTLYLVNLYDKKLYAIDVATKTITGSYAIPTTGCTNGSARPWAIGKYQGSIFVSTTCDGLGTGNPTDMASTSGISNLQSTVFRLDGASFTQIFSFPLTYPREPPFNYGATCNLVNTWKPWTDVLPASCDGDAIGYPTPLLSDIEFDDTGNMILGFIDRTGLQVGYANYGPTGTTSHSLFTGGDILKACKSGATWVIEGSAGCNSARSLAINTNDVEGYKVDWGWLAKAGEFYGGDFFHENGPIDPSFDQTPAVANISYFPGHPETTLGGLVVVPGTGEVMSGSYDPVTSSAANYNTGGVITLNNTTGQRPRNGFQIYGAKKC